MSKDPYGETEKVTVEIELWDKCRQSVVEMPYIADSFHESNLYEETLFRFPTGTNSLGCGPIDYSLVGLPSETFAVSDPNIPNALDIRTKANRYEEKGLYNYIIEGCLHFPADGLKICQQTNDLQIKITDPCEKTIPETQPIKLLSASRLSDDGDFISWPLEDSVDSSTRSYGSDKCGPKAITVHDAETDLPCPFISFDPSLGAIKLEPYLDAPLGIGNYYYEVTMLDYPSQSARQSFQAEVTSCEVKEVSSGNAYINDRQTMWGDDPITVDATDAIAQFTQYPDCGYPIYVKPKVLKPSGERELLPVPHSALFIEEANSYYFEFQKCSAGSYPFDGDCGSIDPYELVYPIVLEAWVMDGPVSVYNDEVRFSVEVGNTCELDSLAIKPRGLVPYWLRTPSIALDDKIEIQQTYSFCPFECTLTQNDKG
jgi:hypothetical protein